jgi:hypothetical protein
MTLSARLYLLYNRFGSYELGLTALVGIRSMVTVVFSL